MYTATHTNDLIKQQDADLRDMIHYILEIKDIYEDICNLGFDPDLTEETLDSYAIEMSLKIQEAAAAAAKIIVKKIDVTTVIGQMLEEIKKNHLTVTDIKKI